MPNISEADARKVAEDSRQREWLPSFMRELFLGSFKPDMLPDYPSKEWRPEFAKLYADMRRFLTEEVDPVAIDESGEYPPEIIEGLNRMRAFGMLVPKEYGGLGLDKLEWCKIMELFGSYDGNLLGLLSPHQSVGVPETVKQFGTPEQKEKYLTRCANGEISAFALTELDVGSDPARLATTAELTPEGDAYIINGTKLWCTNGTVAELLIVMARHPDTGKISCFIVETAWPGITIEQRCHFMGLSALANGVLKFDNVRVPRENIVAGEGKGLRVALTVLNVGRLSVPAGAVGTSKKCLELARRWSNVRVQWGKPIGKHEAIAHKISRMAAMTFAMEAISDVSAQIAIDGKLDLRLEAACGKEWNTCRTWEIIDDLMQIRGGRGYEKERSLEARGEEPMGVERMMRDYRVAKIFEGASEIMHLFMAREAVDKHLQKAGVLLDSKAGIGAKLAALPAIGAFYAGWYATRWLGWGHWPRYSDYGRFAGHMRFVDRASRRLARQTFHGMVVYGPKLEVKQAFLFRIVDIAMELFAMSCAIKRARAMAEQKHVEAEQGGELAELFCAMARRKVNSLFHDLWFNEDAYQYNAAMAVLDGHHTWLEEGIITQEMVMSGSVDGNGGPNGNGHHAPLTPIPDSMKEAVPK
jgi:alkylation response protein AidB-like acyl-CoA dehydrogenase